MKRTQPMSVGETISSHHWRDAMVNAQRVKRRELAAKGGAAVPSEMRSFSQDRALASEAGRIGGKRVPAARRSFSLDKELAREAGRKGGKAPRKKQEQQP